jgi:hypothetical protein
MSWPLSSNSRYKSKIDADEAVSVVSLISSSELVKDKKIHEARAFNFTYRYIDDVYLSIILDLQNFFHWYILQGWKLKKFVECKYEAAYL